MSPRVIQLPMSGRDRRHYVQQLRTAEQAHVAICARLKDAIAVAEAHRVAAWALSCEEWNIRQFIGGDAAPSPAIADALSAGYELIEVRCKRCGHEDRIDLTEVVWPREKPVHSLGRALACKPCQQNGRPKQRPDLVALLCRPEPEPSAPAQRRSQER
jgi:hypothetical protein